MIDELKTRKYLSLFKDELTASQNVVQSREKLNQLMLDAHLGRRDSASPFPVSLGTFVIDPNQYQSIQDDIKVILEAACKVRKAYKNNDPLIRAVVTLGKDEEHLLEFDQADLEKFGVIRFDFFIDQANNWRLTEFNADNPDIILVCDQASRSYFDHILPDTVRSELQKSVDNSDLLEQTLTYVKGGDFNSVGIVGPLDRWVIGENTMSLRAFKDKGYEVVAGNLEDVAYNNGEVSILGTKVDVLRRVTELHYFSENERQIQPLLQALTDKKIAMANSFWDRVLGHKSLFAIFTDPAFSMFFTEEEQAVLSRRIPWTRLLGHAVTTTSDGAEINLEQYALEQKDNLVLKPAGGAEARGVMIGSQMEPQAWADALSEAVLSGESWILQERIWAKPLPVLVDTGQEIEIKDAVADVSVHAFGTAAGPKFGLLFSRYAFAPINNIIAGGGLIFPFVKREK